MRPQDKQVGAVHDGRQVVQLSYRVRQIGGDCRDVHTFLRPIVSCVIARTLATTDEIIFVVITERELVVRGKLRDTTKAKIATMARPYPGDKFFTGG